MKVFDYLDYRQFIRDAVEAAKQKGSNYNYSRLAKAMGIQKSYLSQVLGGRCHLNADQIYKGATFLDMSVLEKEYLVLLLEIERTVVDERRQQLLSKRNELRSMQCLVQQPAA